MDGEHKICVANERRMPGRSAESAGSRPLTDAWAVGAVLAAYDYELFHPWHPRQQRAWVATLAELAGARGRILAEAIPLRLRGYRAAAVDEMVAAT